MKYRKLIILLLPFISIGIYKINQLEVDPFDFGCHYQKQIKGDPETLFLFLTSPYVLEKLLPWLVRFREADKRIMSPGKWYTAIINIPIIGEKRIFATLTEYKPRKLMEFEFVDDYLNQKITIQTRNYHDRSLLKATIYFRHTSLLYQYTIGYILRTVSKNELVKSMKNIATMMENYYGPNEIPYIPRKKIR